MSTASFSFLCTLQGHIPPFGFPSERVMWSKSLLPNVQCSIQEGFRLGILALLFVENGKIIERVGRIRVLWSECLFPDLQYSLVEWLCLGVLALLGVEIGETVERIGHLGMPWSESLLPDVQCSL